MLDLDARLFDALQAHTSKELRNSVLYLAAYSWARAEGWEGFSKVWKNDAVGEAKHAQNFVKFCAKYGKHFKPWPEADGDELPKTVEGLADVALALEMDTQLSMNNLANLADECGDMAACEWISAKLMEQQKETKQSADFAARIADAARSGLGALVILDRQLKHKGW